MLGARETEHRLDAWLRTGSVLWTRTHPLCLVKGISHKVKSFLTPPTLNSLCVCAGFKAGDKSWGCMGRPCLLSIRF